MIDTFITVRSTSSRLPRKCFLPFGQVNILEHIIVRAKDYGLSPIVCTTKSQKDDQIISIASRLNVRSFRGSAVNKLQRWRDCCREFKIKTFHTIDADDPFFCGEEVKRSFNMLKSGYDMIAPPLSSSNGGATVGYSLTSDIVERACKGIDPDTDTEMMWFYIERIKNLKKKILCDPKTAVIKHRMTLDYPEDYILLEAVRLIAGNLATREQVYKVLRDNPDLAIINKFRSIEWADNQRKHNCINNKG
jgi:spore coat polysaccharide biosynthesis protein SpsF (cytidylyltransferase family)